jgi:excisionase family DNA binding protein
MKTEVKLEQTNSNTILDKPLTPEEAGVMMGFSKFTVMRIANRGELPCVRRGNRVRIMTSDVQAWLERQRQTATA